MSREVVRDKVALLAARLIGDQLGEDGHQLLAGCAARRLGPAPRQCACSARHTASGWPGGEYSKPWSLQPPRRPWQDRIEPLQGRNRALRVDAKPRGRLGRFAGQPENIGRLALNVWVLRGQVAFEPLGLKPGALPHPRHPHVADAHGWGQLAAAPGRGTIQRRSAGPFQNLGLQRRALLLHRASAVVGVHARQPLSFATPLPPTAIVGVAAQNPANRPAGFSLRQQQDQPRLAYIFGRQPARTQPLPSVPCARSASSETLLHACFMIHERNTNVSVTGH